MTYEYQIPAVWRRPGDPRALMSLQALALQLGVLLAELTGPVVIRRLEKIEALQHAQIVLNLLSNAIKFSSAGSRIEVGLTRSDGFVQIQVRDQGEDGYTFIRQVRAASDTLRKIPAIALTGRARREDTRLATDAGFDLHVAKPVDPPALCAAVAKLTRRR